MFFKDKEYSSTLHSIGIMPAVAPQEMYDNGAWKEGIQLICGKRCAIISIRMDFESYYKADSLEKVELIKAMILIAVKRMKSRGKFDYDRFKEDFEVFYLDMDVMMD